MATKAKDKQTGAPGSAGPVMDLLLSYRRKKKDLKQGGKQNKNTTNWISTVPFFNWQSMYTLKKTDSFPDYGKKQAAGFPRSWYQDGGSFENLGGKK